MIEWIKRLLCKLFKRKEVESMEENKEEVLEESQPTIHYGSCIGKGHLKEKIPNQDYTIAARKEDAVFAMISDGVSLAYKGVPSNAHKSSKLLAKTSKKLFEKFYNPDLSNDDIRLLLEFIYIKSREELLKMINHQDPNYYHATLILTIYRNHQLSYCYVGDSGLLTIKDQTVESPIYYSQPSGFVQSVINYEKPEGYGFKEVDGFVLATDGIYYKICDRRYEHKYHPFLLNDLIFNYNSKYDLISFLNQLPESITSDDKTVLVVRDFEPFEFDESQSKIELSNDTLFNHLSL